MHQLNFDLPYTADRGYVSHGDEASRAFSRGVVFLAFSGLSWLVVWVAVRFAMNVFGGAGH